ncbi:MAG: glycosyltransferase [Spirochaetales bacterium]|nr:glycosyltransferase [Spirochaetales bacterium]
MSIAVLVLLFFVWLLPFFILWRIPRPTGTLVPEEAAAVPSVSIIIPARNEQLTLPTLFGSLKRQLFPVSEILVVDDHSEDGTAAVAAGAGATVVESAPLPEGWLGKPWACWQGARRAGGELLVFLDADTLMEAGGLESILAAYLQRCGLLSIWPFHRMKRPYERLSALFNIIIMASIGSFTIRGRKSRVLGAFGPCLICSRRDYFAAGGHEAVRGAILEDIALGQAFKRAGFAIHNLGGRGAISFRMYPAGIGSLVGGFTKGMASGARTASLAILIPIVCWVAGGFIVSFLLPVALLGSDLQAAAPWLILHVLYILQIHWILSRMGNYGLLTALLYPLPFGFFAAVFFISLLRTFFLHEVSWKGRKIDIER